MMVEAMGSIFSMFGRSPIRPLQQHMQKAHACAQHLLPFIDAVIKQSWKEAAKLQQEISDLEHDADNMKKDLRLHLPTGLFLPVPRTDVLELLAMQDRVANKAKDIAGLIIGRKMILPESVAKQYPKFLQRCLDASQQACNAINELDELLEAGFRGNEVKVVEEMIVKLDEIEHDTDTMLVDIRKEIFQLETTLSAIDIVFYYKLVEWTGDLADHAQTVGGRLQLLLAR